MLLRSVFHPCAVRIDKPLSHLHPSQVKSLGPADRPDDRVLQPPRNTADGNLTHP